MGRETGLQVIDGVGFRTADSFPVYGERPSGRVDVPGDLPIVPDKHVLVGSYRVVQQMGPGFHVQGQVVQDDHFTVLTELLKGVRVLQPQQGEPRGQSVAEDNGGSEQGAHGCQT